MNKILFLQPALPHYRMDFFSRLAAHYGAALQVHYSLADMGVLTAAVQQPDWAGALAPFRRLPGGLEWQSGGAWLPVARGDVVVISGNPRQVASLILQERALACGAHVVWWAHYHSASPAAWRMALRRLPMSRAQTLLFYTDQEVAAYRSTPAGRRDRRQVHALNNGLYLAPIRAARQAYRAQARPSGVLFIGRLTAKARLDLALDALALMGEAAPVLHVLGDGPERAALNERAGVLGLSSQVVWHQGTTDEAEIASIAGQCRVFLYPGAVGLSLIHAMGHGLPAILHGDSAAHFPEIAAFTADRTGLDFQRDDAADLARVLQIALTDIDRLNRWSAAAVATVEADFNTEAMARRFIGMVETLEY